MEQHEEALGQMDSEIQGQQQILDVIKQSKHQLESHLLESMKQEYHKKIETLEQELVRLQEERNSKSQGQSEQNKQRIAEDYRRKMKDLQKKLEDYKVKDREIQGKKKECEKIKVQMQNLEKEIDKMKYNKVQMSRKLKTESEKHRKLQIER